MNVNPNEIGCKNLPQELQNILPRNAEYLKNIMKFGGYETFESITRLQNKKRNKKNVRLRNYDEGCH